MKRLLNITLITLCVVLLMVSLGCGSDSKEEMFQEGAQYFNEKNFNGAIVMFKNVLEKDPSHKEARLALGRAYMMSGKLDQAEREFSKFLLQDPNNVTANLYLGQYHVLKREPEKAIENLKSYVAQHDDSAEAYEYLGHAYSMMQNWDQGEASFAKSIELNPKRDTAYHGLARVYISSDRRDQARKVIADLLAKMPDNREGLHLLAVIDGQEGNVDQMVATYERIAQRYPDDHYSRYMLGKYYITNNQLDKAQALADELIKVFPEKNAGYKLLGMIRYAEKNYPEAITAFQQSRRISPDLETYHFLGMSYYFNKDSETALSQFRVVTDRVPSYVPARVMISLILFQQGRIDDAQAEAEAVVGMDPQNVVARNILGSVHMKQGDVKAALEEYTEAARLNPESSKAQLRRALISNSLGDEEGTEDALQAAVNAAPSDVSARAILSGYYLRKKEFTKAMSTLKEGLTGDVSDAVLFSQMATVLAAQEKEQEAFELLEKAKKANPEYVVPYFRLASYYMVKNQPEKVLEEYNAILKHHDMSLRALLGKATVLEMLNRDDEAEEVLTKAKSSGDYRVFTAIAGGYLRRKQVDNALTILDEGIASATEPLPVSLYKYDLLVRLGKFDEALALCDGMEKTDPATAQDRRLRIYLLQKDWDNAYKAADRMEVTAPGSGNSMLAKAMVLDMKGDAKGAMDLLENTLNTHGPDSRMMIMLGNLLTREKNYKKAIDYYDAAIKRSPKFAAPYVAKGVVFELQGDVDKAVEMYRHALVLAPGDAPALNNLAMLLADMKEYRQEALQLAYSAYNKLPWDPRILDTFGYALLRNDRSEDAVKVLEKAVAIDDKSGDVLYHLGMTYAALGQKDKAVESLKKSLEDTEFRNAPEAKKLLNSL